LDWKNRQALRQLSLAGIYMQSEHVQSIQSFKKLQRANPSRIDLQ
jgi:hypothetical protein